MERLLEDYKRKQQTIREMIADNDVTEETLKRLKVKQGMINSFIVDIHAAMAECSHEAKAALPLQNVINCPYCGSKKIARWHGLNGINIICVDCGYKGCL